MINLQPVLSEMIKQDQVWNIDKLYTIRNNTCETKVKKTYINSYIYIKE